MLVALGYLSSEPEYWTESGGPVDSAHEGRVWSGVFRAEASSCSKFTTTMSREEEEENKQEGQTFDSSTTPD